MIIPGDFDVIPSVVDRDRYRGNRDKKLVAADLVRHLHFPHPGLFDLQLRKNLPHLVASGPVVDKEVL